MNDSDADTTTRHPMFSPLKGGLLPDVERNEREVDGLRRIRDGLLRYQNDVEQILARALGGYPEAYPHVSDTDDGQLCVGEETLKDVALKTAQRIEHLRGMLELERDTHAATRKRLALTATEKDFVETVEMRLKAAPTDRPLSVKHGTMQALLRIIRRSR